MRISQRVSLARLSAAEESFEVTDLFNFTERPSVRVDLRGLGTTVDRLVEVLRKEMV